MNLISRQIADLALPVLDEIGFELVNVEYLSERGRWVLRLYIDKKGGVGIEDCVRVSRELEDLIEVKDIVGHEYVLEVSSPGLNRPLVKEADFVKVLGKNIKVRMKEKIDGRRNFSGYLKDFKDGTLYIEMENGLIELSWSGIDKANLIYEFEN